MRQDEVIETTILSNENDIQTILYRFFFDQNSINKKLLAQKEVSFHKNMKIASRCQLDGRQEVFFWHDLVCGGSTIIRKKWAHFKRAPYP
jgi:hypothetical protein